MLQFPKETIALKMNSLLSISSILSPSNFSAPSVFASINPYVKEKRKDKEVPVNKLAYECKLIQEAKARTP